MAGAPDGRALVAYIVGSEQQGALMASLATKGVFTAPETVTTGPEARVPAAAYDTASNRWGLAWSNRPNGETKPLQTFLQTSSEPGGPPG
jgi:hypothetical protein